MPLSGAAPIDQESAQSNSSCQKTPDLARRVAASAPAACWAASWLHRAGTRLSKPRKHESTFCRLSIATGIHPTHASTRQYSAAPAALGGKRSIQITSSTGTHSTTSRLPAAFATSRQHSTAFYGTHEVFAAGTSASRRQASVSFRRRQRSQPNGMPFSCAALIDRERFISVSRF